MTNPDEETGLWNFIGENGGMYSYGMPLKAIIRTVFRTRVDVAERTFSAIIPIEFFNREWARDYQRLHVNHDAFIIMESHVTGRAEPRRTYFLRRRPND